MARSSKRLFGAAALVLLAVGGWLGIQIYQFSDKIILPTRYAIEDSPERWGPHYPSAFNLPYESVSFKTEDGLTLRGWLIPHKRAKAGILLVHGRGANRVFMLPLAPALHGAGYDVLLFDLRAHGESEGRFCSMGLKENQDVLAAVRFLKNKTPSRTVGVVAASMGAVAAILATCQSQDIQAIVAETPYTSYKDLITYQGRTRYRLPDWPYYPMVTRLASWRVGGDLEAVRPVDCVGSMTPRPTLWIGAARDTIVPTHHTRDLFQRAQGPKELWIMPVDEHGVVRPQLPKDYMKKVVAFFRKRL